MADHEYEEGILWENFFLIRKKQTQVREQRAGLVSSNNEKLSKKMSLRK
jgi:hypothetical protein